MTKTNTNLNSRVWKWVSINMLITVIAFLSLPPTSTRPPRRQSQKTLHRPVGQGAGTALPNRRKIRRRPAQLPRPIAGGLALRKIKRRNTAVTVFAENHPVE